MKTVDVVRLVLVILFFLGGIWIKRNAYQYQDPYVPKRWQSIIYCLFLMLVK